MASLYAPRLTRRRVAWGDCVEYEGRLLFFRREDCRRLVADDEEDTRECLEIDGKVFPLMEETTVPVFVGGVPKTARCVEYTEDDGSVRLLTVTEGKKKEVAEVYAADGVVRVIGCGGYYNPWIGTVEHVVDVQGAREAYALLVSVREVLGLCRIVRIKRLN